MFGEEGISIVNSVDFGSIALVGENGVVYSTQYCLFFDSRRIIDS